MKILKMPGGRNRPRRWAIGSLALLLAVLVGCGKSSTITGKVTYREHLVTSGSVIFEAGDKKTHTSPINSEGEYKFEKLPPGIYDVGVISRDPSKGRSVSRGHKPTPNDRPPADWFPVPSKFESPASSGFKCEVKPGEESYDIEMK